MSFNPDPNNIEVLFSHKMNPPIHPPLNFNNQEVCSAAHQKHQTNNCQAYLPENFHCTQRYWNHQIAPTKTLDQIYKIFVRPHMDYCHIIYHLPHSTSAFDCPINLNFMMQSLESTQYQAALAVSGGENVLHEIPCRTSRFLNSFFPDTIRSWDNIVCEFRNCSSLSKFKSKLLNLIRPPKKSIFGIHDRCGIKLLFQLRVGLSHNFLDTPSAISDCAVGKEDTIHFFTECALFATIRTNLMRSISIILTHNNLEHLSHAELTQLYLYGHTNLGKTLNCLVQQASIKYIHDTKRFTRS